MRLAVCALTLASVQRGTEPKDDGGEGTTSAGAGSVRQQLRLRDCYRRVSHHRPGDILITCQPS